MTTQNTGKDDPIRCPNCGSAQVAPTKTGFQSDNACAGCCLLGPLGLLLGHIGSGETRLVCMKCGHQWNPKAQQSGGMNLFQGCLILFFIVIVLIIWAGSCSTNS
jgi:hypothetical protein